MSKQTIGFTLKMLVSALFCDSSHTFSAQRKLNGEKLNESQLLGRPTILRLIEIALFRTFCCVPLRFIRDLKVIG